MYFCSSEIVVKNLEMRNDILEIKTVNDCGKCLGSKIEHPQACVFNLENPDVDSSPVKFDFYAVLLIEDCGEDGCCCCGRRYYDFSNASMVFLKPGEIFRMTSDNTLPAKGLLLTFHPDLLFRTTLDNHIGNYTFFSYRKQEALHLSHSEKEIVMKCLHSIAEEISHPIDSHSSILISRLIELLLDYCSRFYERQFITREEKNKAIMGNLEKIIGNSIFQNSGDKADIPDAEQCARKLNLSEAYFRDLLKFETGKTFDEYLMMRKLDAAKKMLISGSMTPAAVARSLGFASFQQFSFIFRKITGSVPSEYRLSRN